MLFDFCFFPPNRSRDLIDPSNRFWLTSISLTRLEEASHEASTEDQSDESEKSLGGGIHVRFVKAGDISEAVTLEK